MLAEKHAVVSLLSGMVALATIVACTGIRQPESATQRATAAGIQALEITATSHATSREFDAAIKIMRKAAALVDVMPVPPGPPPLIKPVHELFGEILLRCGRAKDAAEQFAISLERHPNRARSLLGAARAFAQSGDRRRAEKFYSQFAQQWQHARPQAPELREARAYASAG